MKLDAEDREAFLSQKDIQKKVAAEFLMTINNCEDSFEAKMELKSLCDHNEITAKTKSILTEVINYAESGYRSYNSYLHAKEEQAQPRPMNHSWESL